MSAPSSEHSKTVHESDAEDRRSQEPATAQMAPPTGPPPMPSRGASFQRLGGATSAAHDERNQHDILYRIARARLNFMEYAGEFFGTLILVMFGCGANCQVNLGSNSAVVSSGMGAGNWTSLSLGWGAGIAFGVWLTGGHINPAVTLAFTLWRGFPLRKVPFYILSQLLGALCGAAIVYGNYISAIDLVEGGRGVRTMKTAGLFGTVPVNYLTNISCFFSEFIGTALLLFGLLALTDKRNKLTPGLVSLGFFVVFMGIAACFGMQTGFALNPARDLGPRMLTSMVGYGTQVYSLRSQYWLWCPILASILGAQFGTMLYDIFLYSGEDSLVNRILDRRVGALRSRHDGQGKSGHQYV